MSVYFKPEKKCWQFWKRNRYLTEGEDYVFDGAFLKLLKPFIGEISVEHKTR